MGASNIRTSECQKVLLSKLMQYSNSKPYMDGDDGVLGGNAATVS